MKQLRFFASASLLACLLSFANVAQAQQGLSEAGSAVQRLVDDFGFSALDRLPTPSLTTTRNLAKLVQLGNSNIAEANQTNFGGSANQAYIMQVGLRNEAMLVQQGSGNATTISQRGSDNVTNVNQQGNNNVANSLVTGNNINTTIDQQGDGNSSKRDITTNGADFKLTQLGNNNQLRQTGTESLAPPRYEVEMRGNGIQLSIQNGRIGQ